jgi:ubiquitin carboxyl-terminal hydrolase L3
MPKKWLPLESNPEVMTEFASRIGLDTSQVAFHDIFGLDPEVKRASC